MVGKVKDIGDINKGDFLKVSQLDKSIAVSHRLNFTGKVIQKLKVNGSWMIEVKTFDFVTGVEFDPEKFEYTKLSRAPGGWAEFEKTGKNINAKEPKKVKPIKTHKQKVFELVKDNPRKQLNGLLTLAKKEIGGDETRLKLELQLAIKKLRS